MQPAGGSVTEVGSHFQSANAQYQRRCVYMYSSSIITKSRDAVSMRGTGRATLKLGVYWAAVVG